MTDAGFTNILERARAKSSGRPKATHSTISLDDIQDRQSNTRDLNQQHVSALAESMSVVGLIEPLVVDQDGVLLAGGHRRAAILRLREQLPEQYEQHFSNNQVPARFMAFKASEEPDRAIEVEIAENEQRLNYSRAEVLAIAEQLKAAGYSSTPGRPKKGEKRLKPALSAIFGKSLRTVERYLAEESADTTEKTPTNGGVLSFDELSPDELKAQLHQIYQKLRQKKNWEAIAVSPKLLKKVQKIELAMEDVLRQIG